MIGFCYNSKRVELYDPSQARDESGKWTGSGGGEGKSSLGETTSVNHGTTPDVLKKNSDTGLQPSKDGVHGKGVYATDNQRLALEYGCLKAPMSSKIGGKVLLGLVEVVASGFKNVYKTEKQEGSYSVFLSEKKVEPSQIKRMMVFDAKSVRKWIFEGGKKPVPLATKSLQEGSIFVPIIIDETPEGLEVEYVGSPKESCPVATQDIKTNLKNRKHAVDDASYGPANPKEPNEEFWKSMAKNFNTNVEEAKTMRCGNCAAFNKTSRMLACIKKGIGEDADEVAKAGDLGFCEFFDFKCASLRTCSAWVVGGPITDKDEKEELDCGTGAGGFKSGNTCAKGGGAEEKVKKLVEQIKKEDPKADVGSELVRRGADSLVKAVSGASVKATYGVTKAKEIAKWIRSSEGQKFMGNVASGLRLTGAGAIGALRGIHNARFKILVSGLINPALVPYFVSASAMKGFFDGAVKEYRNEGGGRQISNAIRSKIAVKPMQAFVQTISLQAKNPPIEDVVAYLTDVLRVSIDEAIEGKRTFEITSFYDPSQARDESGKWTGGGAGSAEPSMPIYDEDENPSTRPIGNSPEEVEQAKEIEDQLDKQQIQYAEEFMQVIGPPVRSDVSNSTQYKKDVVAWSRSLESSDVDVEEATHMAQTLHHYSGSAHREINEYLRTMDQAENPDLEIMGMAESMIKALEVAPKIGQRQVWRGLKSGTERPLGQDFVHKLAKTAKKGQIIRDSGFGSYSLSDGVAKDFANWGSVRGNAGTQSKIFIKVKNANGYGVKMPLFSTSFVNEKEVLFPPDSRLKITSVKSTKEPRSAFFKGEDTHTYQTEIEAEVIK